MFLLTKELSFTEAISTWTVEELQAAMLAAAEILQVPGYPVTPPVAPFWEAAPGVQTSVEGVEAVPTDAPSAKAPRKRKALDDEDAAGEGSQPKRARCESSEADSEDQYVASLVNAFEQQQSVHLVDTSVAPFWDTVIDVSPHIEDIGEPVSALPAKALGKRKADDEYAASEGSQPKRARYTYPELVSVDQPAPAPPVGTPYADADAVCSASAPPISDEEFAMIIKMANRTCSPPMGMSPLADLPLDMPFEASPVMADTPTVIAQTFPTPLAPGDPLILGGSPVDNTHAQNFYNTHIVPAGSSLGSEYTPMLAEAAYQTDAVYDVTFFTRYPAMGPYLSARHSLAEECHAGPSRIPDGRHYENATIRLSSQAPPSTPSRNAKKGKTPAQAKPRKQPSVNKPMPYRCYIGDCTHSSGCSSDRLRHMRIHFNGSKVNQAKAQCPYCEHWFSRCDARTRHFKAKPDCGRRAEEALQRAGKQPPRTIENAWELFEFIHTVRRPDPNDPHDRKLFNDVNKCRIDYGLESWA